MRALALPAALTLGLGLACMCAGDPETLAAQKAEDDAALAKAAASLGRIAADAAPVPEQDVPCDAARIDALLAANHTDHKHVMPIRAERLQGFRNGRPFEGTARDAADGLNVLDQGLFDELQAPIDPAKDEADLRVQSSQLAQALTYNNPVVAVTRARVATLPVITRENGEDVFDPGVWAGAVVLYDLRTGERLCSAPFTAESSEVVEWADRGAPTTPEQRVLWDYQEQVKANLRAALGRIAPAVTLY